MKNIIEGTHVAPEKSKVVNSGENIQMVSVRELIPRYKKIIPSTNHSKTSEIRYFGFLSIFSPIITDQ